MNRERFRRAAGPLSVETAGKTVDEAIQAALGRLRARRDEVEVEVLQEGRGGLFGIGSREARVRVRRQDKSAPRSDGRIERRPSVSAGEPPGRRGVPSGRRGIEDIDRLEREVEKHRTARGAAPRDPRTVPAASEVRTPAQSSAPRRREPVTGPPDVRPLAPRGDSGGPRRRSGSGSRPQAGGRSEERSIQPPRAAVTRSTPPIVEPALQPSSPATVEPAVLADFTLGVLTRMGYTARVEASYADDAYEVRIDAGEHNEILIGKKGETIDALQHVLAKMASRGLEELLRVRVDIAEYRQKRSSELSERALEMAQQVVETGREIITEPLSAAERRSIHRALSDHPAVTTQSLGDGQVKPVWIGPKSAKPSPADVPPIVVHRGGASRSAPSRVYAEDQVREGRTDPVPAPVRPPAAPVAVPAAPAVPNAPAPRTPVEPRDSFSGNKDKPAASEPAPEWGRRPKPARGRRK
jgi:spoIIIJ-associated protein